MLEEPVGKASVFRRDSLLPDSSNRDYLLPEAAGKATVFLRLDSLLPAASACEEELGAVHGGKGGAGGNGSVGGGGRLPGGVFEECSITPSVALRLFRDKERGEGSRVGCHGKAAGRGNGGAGGAEEGGRER